MQPFPIGTFQKGGNVVNEMLMKRLRGPNCHGDISEDVALFKPMRGIGEDKITPCVACGQSYTKDQWKDMCGEHAWKNRQDSAHSKAACLVCPSCKTTSSEAQCVECKKTYTKDQWKDMCTKHAWTNRHDPKKNKAKRLVCTPCIPVGNKRKRKSSV